MDDAEALRALEDFLALLEQNRRALARYRKGHGPPSHRDISHTLLVQSQPLVEDIARALDGEATKRRIAPSGLDWCWDPAFSAVHRLIGILRDRDRMKSVFPSAGPSLKAEAMHEWVWPTVQPQWNAGLYQEAVLAAAKFVDDQTKKKLGRRDLDGTELYQEAFSLSDPANSRGRLRMRGLNKQDKKAWNSAHLGAMELGKAVSSGMRNPAAHQSVQLSEQEALEQLATISTLARWVDASDLETAPLSSQASRLPDEPEGGALRISA